MTCRLLPAPTVPAKQLIMLDAANFASAEGDTPDISSSREVALHAEDTLPLPIVGGTVQPPPLSGDRRAGVFDIPECDNCCSLNSRLGSWIMTRAGRVSFINSVSW